MLKKGQREGRREYRMLEKIRKGHMLLTGQGTYEKVKDWVKKGLERLHKVTGE